MTNPKKIVQKILNDKVGKNYLADDEEIADWDDSKI